ncbi:hypothetical protein [Actinomadura algeriensis]|uniref:Ferredoxin n=1 Tax=Actinomadura algeriensis TaxID=1679523 RepID=A0ABR9K240_9ACTN|nr:hypothetical protein [Actinomadura algeriensis]MBE1536916.1 hypothetical protein [Actinomadura algeriensis]
MTERPFTLVACQAGPCRPFPPDRDVLPRLAEAVRRCPHGVLVRTGCLLRAPRCRSQVPHDSGCYLVVQPCDAGRRPRGAAMAIGPILTHADADAVAAWLIDGDLAARRLPPRLRAPTSATPHR